MSVLGSSPAPSSVRIGRLLAAGAAALALSLTGCTAGDDPGASASPSAEAEQVVIDITLSDGDQVDPNGEKIDVEQGQTVVLNVTSDREDEIHVHGDIEVAVPVSADGTASESFVADAVGSFEVESHHPNKIIAVLNVR